MSQTAEFIRKFDSNLIAQLNEAYTAKKSINNLNGIELYHEPFTHCIISNLVEDENLINDLNKEAKSKLKYAQKNNDLYKFHQTGDLGNCKSKNIQKFRDQVLYGSLRNFLENITNIELSSTKIDVTSSKYEYTDYLLCHDDDIHDVNQHGRRIAFIYYMVPKDWSHNDGGNLDLFKVNDNLQPIEISKTITPKHNSLLFFEVSDRSFHQVSEVLSKTKTRLSINGWFHGPINYRPVPTIDPLPEPKPYINIDSSLFFEWIVEKYLNPTNQTEIQLKFSNSSEIKLEKIFNSKKFEEVAEALDSKDIIWTKKGPANRRNYEIADSDSLPQIIKDLVQVLTCDFMGLTLSNMTALALHSSIPKSKDESELDDDNDDDSFEEDEDEDNNDDDEDDDDDEEDEEKTDNTSDEKDQEESDDDEDDDDKDDVNEKNKNNKKTSKLNPNKRKSTKSNANKESDEDDEDSSDDNDSSGEDTSNKPGTSSSKLQSENLFKKFKSTHESSSTNTTNNNKTDTEPTTSSSVDRSSSSSQSDAQSSRAENTLPNTEKATNEPNLSPKCHIEIRKWKQGHYTLITDDDKEIKSKALDLMIFFKCKQWSLDCGGNISYIARDEDNELLTVNPEENCISLIYRDEETLKFTKFINSKITQINKNGCFYEIFVIYYE